MANVGYSYSGSALLKSHVTIRDLDEPPTDTSSGSYAPTRNYVDARTAMMSTGDSSSNPQPFARYISPFTQPALHVTAGGNFAGDTPFLITCGAASDGVMLHNMQVPFNPQRLFQNTSACLASCIVTKTRVTGNPAFYSTAYILRSPGTAFGRLALNFANPSIVSDAINVPTNAVHISTDELVTSPAIPVGGPRLYIARGTSGLTIYNLPSLPVATINDPSVTKSLPADSVSSIFCTEVYNVSVLGSRILLMGSDLGFSQIDVTTLTLGGITSTSVGVIKCLSQVAVTGPTYYLYGAGGSTQVHRVTMIGGAFFSPVSSAIKAGAVYNAIVATVQSGTTRVYAADGQTTAPGIDVYAENLGSITQFVAAPSIAPIRWLSLNYNSTILWAGTNVGVQGFALSGLNSLAPFSLDVLGRMSVGLQRITGSSEAVNANSTAVIILNGVASGSHTLPVGSVPGQFRFAINFTSAAQDLVGPANTVYTKGAASAAPNKTTVRLGAGGTCILLWDGLGWSVIGDVGGATTP